VKALFVGLGSVGQRHARNLRTLLGDDVELLAYRVRGHRQVITPSLSIDAGADVESALGVRVFRDLDAALAERPDVVFVTNPNTLHVPVALAAATAGCHLFLEKPISHDLARTDELVDVIERRRCVCLVGYQLRFHPGFRALQRMLAERAVGRLVTVRVVFGEYLPGWHPYEDYRTMHVSRRELGGGVLLAQIHDLDAIYALFGLPRRVFAMGGHLSRLEIDVEDTASLLLDAVVDGMPVPVHVHQDYLQRPPRRTYDVIGEGGRILLDFGAGSLTRVHAEGRVGETESFAGFDRNQMFLDELRHFLACVAGRETPLVTARDGVQSLRMALAARAALETGRVMELQ
jgi:predicted dehydrogenase